MWRRSKFSFANGNCVEVDDEEVIRVRDSKQEDQDYPVILEFSPGAWMEFLDTVDS